MGDIEVMGFLTFGIRGGKAPAPGHPSPAGIGLSPTIHNSKLALPKKWVKGCPVFQSSSSWQQPGCQGLPELALAVSMATGGTPAPSTSEKGWGLAQQLWSPAPTGTPGALHSPNSSLLTIACPHLPHVLPDVPSGHRISLCCPILSYVLPQYSPHLPQFCVPLWSPQILPLRHPFP